MAEEIQSAPATPQPTPKGKEKGKSLWSIIGTVLTLYAWAMLMFVNGYTALICGIISLGISIAGCGLNHGGYRRLAIACIVASSVLIIVVAAFLIGLRVILG